MQSDTRKQSGQAALGAVENNANLGQEMRTPRRGFWRSTAYLPEYFVMLVLLLVLVGSVSSLLAIGIDDLVKSEDLVTVSNPYIGNVTSFQLAWSLAALLATLPVFAWLFVRTRNTEAEVPAVKQHRWRKGFLGAFLAIVGLSAVWSLGGFFFGLLARMLGEEGTLMSMLFVSPNPWWQDLIATGVNLGVLTLVIYVMSRDYRAKAV